MKERFENLYKLPSNLYAENSPVIIVAGSLLKDTESSNLIIQLKYQSLSDKKIKALKIKLNVYDVTKQLLGEDIEYQYLDLSVFNGQDFGANKAIIVPNSVARSFSIKEYTVIYDNNEQWVLTIPLVQLINSQSLSTELKDPEVVKQYRIATNDSANYVPKEMHGLWQCACGEWNKQSLCNKCRLSKTKIFGSYDSETLKENAKIRVADEKQQHEDAIAKEEAQQKKRNKIFKVCSIVVVAILVVVIGSWITYNVWWIPYCTNLRYEDAEAYLENGEYDLAISIYDELGNYKDSQEKILESKYQKADNLMQQGQYREAKKIFQEINGYVDAKDRVENATSWIRYSEALDDYNRENYRTAYKAFYELGTFENSREMYKDSCEKYVDQLLEEGKYGDAITLYETVEYNGEKYKIACEKYADKLYDEGNYSGAVSNYEKCNIKGNNYLEACYLCGKSWFEKKNNNMAIYYFERIPGYKDVADLHGQALEIENQKEIYSYALDAFNEADAVGALAYLNQLPDDYEDANKMKNICTLYQNIMGNWTCTRRYISYDYEWSSDRFDVEDYGLKVFVDINGEISVREYIEYPFGSRYSATLEGNLLKWDYYNCLDISNGKRYEHNEYEYDYVKE